MGRYHEVKRRRCGNQIICNRDDLTLNLGGCRWLSCTVGKYSRNRRKQAISGLEPKLTLQRVIHLCTIPSQPSLAGAHRPMVSAVLRLVRIWGPQVPFLPEIQFFTLVECVPSFHLVCSS